MTGWWRARRSFRGTIVLSTVGIMAVAMVAVGVGIQVVLARTADHDIERVLRERADATVDIVQQASSAELRVPPDAIEPGVLVFNGRGKRVAGTIEPSAREVADRLATSASSQLATGPGDAVRLLAQPFRTPGGERAVVVVSEVTRPYERAELYALLATGALGLLVVAVTALMALRVTRQALAPVAQMAARAADWSEHDLSHRFHLGPPTNELAALGETLDHLLGRVAAAIRSEQRLTSELAHELRTPLTAIQGSAELALLRGVDDPAVRGDLEQIARSARDMALVIATLLDVARSGGPSSGGETCTAAEGVALLAWRRRSGVDVDDRSPAARGRVAAPAALVARLLQPLVDNAVQHARSSVVIEAADVDGSVLVTVRDDGPGVSEERRADLFEPGVSGRSDGAGLGLGIARRIASAIGAQIDADHPASGASFTVSLPTR